MLYLYEDDQQGYCVCHNGRKNVNILSIAPNSDHGHHALGGGDVLKKIHGEFIWLSLGS